MFIISFAFSQDKGDWQTITTMNDVTDLVIGQDKVWFSSTGGIFSYNKSTGKTERFTNIEGLQSINLDAIELDTHGNVIAGGYKGIIEIYNKDTKCCAHLSDIYGNPVKDLLFQNDTLWAAAGKGVAVFLWNGSAYKFRSFFNIFEILPDEVFYIQLFAGRIWLGTNKGLLTAPADLSKYTIENPDLWELFDTSNGLTYNKVLDMQIINGKLWVGTGSGLVTIDSSLNIQTEASWGGYTSNFLAQIGDTIYIANYSRYYSYTSQTGRVKEYNFDSNITILRADDLGRLWLGLDEGGFYCSDWDKPFKFDDPAKNGVRYIIKDSDKNIWASTGKVQSTPNQGFFINNGQNWTSIDFGGYRWSDLGNTDVIYEDRFKNIWFGSWGGGVMVKRNDEFLYFHNYESAGTMYITTKDSCETVELPVLDEMYRDFFRPVPITSYTIPEYEVITTIKEDNYGRLWFGNYWADNNNLIAVAPYTNDGFVSLDKSDWTYFSKTDGINPATEGGVCFIVFDDYDRAWIGTVKDGVYILDYNGTLKDKNDDKVYHYDTNNGLCSNYILSLAVDKDGMVWIGTAGGLNSFDGINIYRHVGDLTGETGPLEDRINHIFVDSYNNKWFATPAGLSVLRAGKSAWEAHAWQGFTTENSGLVDNEVHNVYVDAATSEALIGTEQGISIYRGAFAEIQDDYSQTIGGPNPFILDGGNQKFILCNLVNISTVKILNLNGALVRELTIENHLVDGGRAVWDGRDSFGKQAATGIYFYLAFTEDGKSVAGKIAVIRK